jgi:RNase P subunit RPR2
MPTPDHQRQFVRSPRKPTPHSNDWRCTRCDKLLGVSRDGRMHLRFARGHEYFVSFPVVATCRGCGTLNQVTDPAQH